MMGAFSILFFVLLAIGFLYFIREAPGRGENDGCRTGRRDGPGSWRR
jgi:hypothetical protein